MAHLPGRNPGYSVALDSPARSGVALFCPKRGWCQPATEHFQLSMSLKSLQALEEERLGPRRRPYSDERQRRLAVQEAATALACTLLPAIEPVLTARCPFILRPCSSSRAPTCLQASFMHDLLLRLLLGCRLLDNLASIMVPIQFGRS